MISIKKFLIVLIVLQCSSLRSDYWLSGDDSYQGESYDDDCANCSNVLDFATEALWPVASVVNTYLQTSSLETQLDMTHNAEKTRLEMMHEQSKMGHEACQTRFNNYLDYSLERGALPVVPNEAVDLLNTCNREPVAGNFAGYGGLGQTVIGTGSNLFIAGGYEQSFLNGMVGPNFAHQNFRNQVNSNAILNANAQARMNFNAGGNLNVNAGGRLNFNAGGNLNVNAGGRMNFHAGGGSLNANNALSNYSLLRKNDFIYTPQTYEQERLASQRQQYLQQQQYLQRQQSLQQQQYLQRQQEAYRQQQAMRDRQAAIDRQNNVLLQRQAINRQGKIKTDQALLENYNNAYNNLKQAQSQAYYPYSNQVASNQVATYAAPSAHIGFGFDASANLNLAFGL